MKRSSKARTGNKPTRAAIKRPLAAHPRMSLIYPNKMLAKISPPAVGKLTSFCTFRRSFTSFFLAGRSFARHNGTPERPLVPALFGTQKWQPDRFRLAAVRKGRSMKSLRVGLLVAGLGLSLGLRHAWRSMKSTSCSTARRFPLPKIRRRCWAWRSPTAPPPPTTSPAPPRPPES